MPGDNYINNKEMHAELVQCRETGELSDKAADAFMQIVMNYSKKNRFFGYSYLEEMQGEALATMCEKWDRYDPTRTQNPFAYFTQIAHNCFIAQLNKEKRHQRIRDEILTYYGQNASWSYQDYRREADKAEQGSDNGSKQAPPTRKHRAKAA